MAKPCVVLLCPVCDVNRPPVQCSHAEDAPHPLVTQESSLLSDRLAIFSVQGTFIVPNAQKLFM